VRPARYRTRITHGRAERVGHGFAYRHPMWLVDLDAVPVLRRGLRVLGSFDPVDHLGDPTSSLRANVDTFLGLHGLDVAGGQVLMLANARSFGYAFNPLSVFWCYDRGGALVAVVAEVHNTYGERHCYLLEPDERGRAEAGKEFYVSPFLTVDGCYRMALAEPRERLSIRMELVQDGRRVFQASLTGRRRPLTPRMLMRVAGRHPFMTARVSALIRYHGVKLWARGVPRVPRPTHTPQRWVG